jgi:hypothetical protein
MYNQQNQCTISEIKMRKGRREEANASLPDFAFP